MGVYGHCKKKPTNCGLGSNKDRNKTSTFEAYHNTCDLYLNWHFSHNNGMESEVVGSKANEHVCNLPINNNNNKSYYNIYKILPN